VGRKNKSKNKELGVETGTKREIFLKNTKGDLERQNEVYEHNIYLNKEVIGLLDVLIKREKEKFK